MASTQLPKDFKHKFFFYDCVVVFTSNANSNQIHEVNCIMLDLTKVEVDVEVNKKWKKVYERNCRFQDTWCDKWKH
jgi:hypothetical protein